MNVQKYAPLGSVSSGTMRPEDLIPAFLDALEPLDSAAYALLSEEYYAESIEGMESEADEWTMDSLFDALDAVAPPYCYFGAHEGDGADYGFWISWDSLEDASRAGAVLKIAAGDEWPADLDGAEYVLEITDHGNASLYSLYRLDGSEVWSRV